MVRVGQGVDDEDFRRRLRSSGEAQSGGARSSARRRESVIDVRGSGSSAVPECRFCEMLARAAPVCVGVRSAAYDAFKPWSPGHVLVLPRDHISDFWDLSIEAQLDVLSVVLAARRELDQRFEPDGYNVQISVGTAAGQSGEHAVIHVIPRYSSCPSEAGDSHRSCPSDRSRLSAYAGLDRKRATREGDA